MNPWQQTDYDRSGWDNQIRENSSRGAWAFGTAHSNGWGEILIRKPIMFGLTYLHEPFTTYGHALDDDDQLVDNRFPRCTGGVARWVQDRRDFYVGAHVFVTVSTADPLLGAADLWNKEMAGGTSEYSTDANYDITHHWMFFGLAIKDIGAADFQD